MKIAYCIPAYNKMAGMERVLTQKVNYLKAQTNFDVVIITTDQDGKKELSEMNNDVKFIHTNINFNDNFEYGFLKKYIDYKSKQKKYRKELQNILIENQVDICISMGGKEIDFLPLLEDKSSKICELHFSKDIYKRFYKSRRNTFFSKVHAEIMSKRLEIACKKFDKLVVLTKRDEKEWKKIMTNVEQIYNPFSSQNLYQTDYSARGVIAVGRLDEQKGFTHLIDVWNDVHQLHPEWILNIWGEGPLRDSLMDKIYAKGMQNTIFLRGSTDKISEEYSKNSIFVMTSQYEGFPMVLLEASAAGLPLISFDCNTGPSEIICNNKNGYLIPLNDLTAMSKSIVKLIEDSNLRSKFGKNAQSIVSKFEISSIMDRWLKIFNSSINN